MRSGTSSFRGGGLPGAAHGVVDHRFARRALIAEYRKGRLARHQVCDAPSELVRVAANVGQPMRTACPICAERAMVLVTFVFGPGLPASGRCVSGKGELARLARRSQPSTAYFVEVCRECSWHHLLEVHPVGGRPARPVKGTGST